MHDKETIYIRRGYDIKLDGEAVRELVNLSKTGYISVMPSDFKYVIPKLLVEQNDEVDAGQALFFDKDFPEIKFPSPVSGIVSDILRGEKRRITEIRIIPDKGDFRYMKFPESSPDSLDETTIRQVLLDSGCWCYIRQRPFGTIAASTDTPKAIFISCFDSAPLAPDLGFIISQEPENFNTGLAALHKLCPDIHLGLREKQDINLPAELSAISKHYFKGPHPAGNVGIQIHHIDPIAKGDKVWFVHPQDVMIIGRLFREGRYRAERIVALTGSGLRETKYYKMLPGQKLDSILEKAFADSQYRIIQGNVLHGRKSSSEDSLSFYENHITVIPEGDEPEFLGWLLPGFKKLSLSRTFFSWFFKNRSYRLDTNIHGEERAFVMTGQYEKVLPMNILPVYLLKSILAKDIERMEQLGIYEVAEEDFALCEFICTSKINVQNIIAEGLDIMRKEE